MFSVHKRKIKEETIWIFKILQIQKRIVPAETIRGNTVKSIRPAASTKTMIDYEVSKSVKNLLNTFPFTMKNLTEFDL